MHFYRKKTIVFFIIILSLKSYENLNIVIEQINFLDNVSLGFLKINKS